MTSKYADGYVQQIMDHLSIPFEEKGAELWALCPGHRRMVGREDHNPSWSINSESGAHKCFSCGYSGNLPTLVRDMGGDIRLIDEGVLPVREGWHVNRDLQPMQPDAPDDKYMDPTQMVLFRVQIPLAVLDSRRLDMPSVQAYDVGWDAPASAWIFPFYSPYSDALIGYQAKSVIDRKFRNHPPGISKANTLFGYQTVRDERRVTVVESPLDAVLLYRMGYPAVAACGSRLSDVQLDLLSGFEFVTLAFDNDDAGRLEVKRLARMMLPFRYRVVKYAPDSPKDVGEMSGEEIEELLR